MSNSARQRFEEIKKFGYDMPYFEFLISLVEKAVEIADRRFADVDSDRGFNDGHDEYLKDVWSEIEEGMKEKK